MSKNGVLGLIQKLSFSHENGVPMTSKYLKTHKISHALTYKYVQNGWLRKVANGVYLFGNEELNLFGVVSAILRDTGFYIGGRSALALHGNFHYFRIEEIVEIFGNNPKYKIPQWTKKFNLKYTTKIPFDFTLTGNQFISKLENSSYPTLFVSDRERAMLELIYGIGTLYSKEEAMQIIETLTTLRKNTLVVLLRHCDSMRTLRECRTMSKRFDMPWKDVVFEICDEKKIK